MDKVNKMIITEFSKNSKVKLKDLTYIISISKQSLLNRINKLIEDQYILPYTITNYFNIGKKNVHLHIKFEKINFEEINKIIYELIKKNSIVWIAETFHKYDLSIAIIYRDFKVVEKFINDIKELSSNNIKVIDMSFIKENYYFSFDFNNENNRKVIKISKSLINRIKLRKNEEKLIKIISSNGRFKLTDLGQKLNLTANSVKYLIKELEKKEIILGYGCFINYLKLDYKWFQIIFETYNKKIIDKIFSLQNIVFISKTFDEKIIIDFVFKNISEVRNLINEIELIIGKINNYEIYELIKIYKLEDPNK